MYLYCYPGMLTFVGNYKHLLKTEGGGARAKKQMFDINQQQANAFVSLPCSFLAVKTSLFSLYFKKKSCSIVICLTSEIFLV